MISKNRSTVFASATPAPFDLHGQINANLSHPHLSWQEESYSLGLLRHEALYDEPQIRYISFKDLVLPPNQLFSRPQLMRSRPDFILAIVLAIQTYIQRVEPSKTRTGRAVAMFLILINFVEFLWLKDIININSAVPADVEELPSLLAYSWLHALNIHQRARLVNPMELERAITPITDGGGGPELIRTMLATNCIWLIYRRKNEFDHILLGKEDEKPTIKQMSESSIRESLLAINYLNFADHECCLQFMPFRSARKSSAKYGVATGRTENLHLKDAVKIITTAYNWLYLTMPHVIGLLKELSAEAESKWKSGKAVIGVNFSSIIKESQHRHGIENGLRGTLSERDNNLRGSPSAYSFREVVRCALSACFVIIATMNARRRDEISHRKFGLRTGDMRIVDAALGIYEGDFYVEKTFKERVPFYVNQVTYDAIKSLDEISTEFQKITSFSEGDSYEPKEKISLFQYRRISHRHGIGSYKNYYVFAAYDGDSGAKLFLKLALGDNFEIKIHAHMFRRLYGLIFTNRWDNGDLQALSNQYGHNNMPSTVLYVTDPRSRSEMESIPFKMGVNPKDQEKAYFQQKAEISEVLGEAGLEKMLQDISSVLDGVEYYGKYVKYIRRLQIKLAATTRFSNLDLDGKKSHIFSVLRSRRHSPQQFPHGQCMAGSSTNIVAGKCHSKNDNSLHREKAGLAVCGNCFFHLSNPLYLRNVATEIEFQREKLAWMLPGTVLALNAAEELENLELAMKLITSRRGA